jgi:asparagine synthase (glutamine-hydrolysing)
MCGLGGVFRFPGTAPLPAEDRVPAAMLRQLHHRGPDDGTVLRWDGAALVFTRLALTAPGAGQQPFASADGLVHLIANGEVYNHRELERELPGPAAWSGSDCEVLLHLYERDGLAFLDRVRGMVAVVVVDRRRGRVVLGRDRFGIKPLFLATPPGRLVVGSEIKTLFTHPAVPREVDWPAALASQALSAAPRLDTAPPRSWFRGVEMVPAGTVTAISLRDGSRRERTVRPAAADLSALVTAEDYVHAFGELLAESVRACATSDAGVGLFLSGGLDSAAVAVLARDRDVPTFSALTPTTVRSGDAPAAWDLAREYGLPHHQVLFAPADVPDPDRWANLVRSMETPQCGPEQFYKDGLHRYAKARYPGLKAMLLGAAADEYCGGYTDTISPDGSWEGFLDAVATMSPRHAPEWHTAAGPLLRPGWADPAGGEPADPYREFAAWKARDVTQYNLWHEDRTAAASGVEARVPFLDQRLVRLVESIPEKLRPDLLWDKRIVRDAVAGVLGTRWRQREKVPFHAGTGYRHTYRGFAAMLAADGHRLLDMALGSAAARRVLDADTIRRTIDGLADRPGPGTVERVLRLVNLGLLAGMTPDTVAYPAGTDLAAIELSPANAGAPLPVPPTVQPGPLWTERSVLALTGGAAIVADLRDGAVFLARDGEFEFELAGTDAPWTRFLLAVDGTRTVAQLAAGTGVPAAEHAEDLDTLITAGLLAVDR